MSPESAAQAAAALRDHDRDRYFATLVLPAAARPAVQALYAFGAEVATVRERVSDPAPGEIRLQWWSDALTGEGHGAVRQNPVADALLSAVGEYRLPTAPLERLIEARRFDLYHDAMPDMPSFEGYAGETVSVLYQLAAMILAGGQPVEAADAAGHLGVAQALTGHLRAFGYNAADGRIFLPLSVLTANGVVAADVLKGRGGEALTRALGQLADIAADHLTKAQAAIDAVPPGVRPAFASVALLPGALRRARAQATTPFALPPDTAEWRKIATLTWWSWRKGR